METQIKLYPDYTAKSFVVAGEGTRFYKSKLKELGGTFVQTFKGSEQHPGLAGQAGWVFANKHYDVVVAFLNQVVNQQVAPTDQVEASQLENKTISYRMYQPEIGQKMAIVMQGQEYPYQVIKTEIKDNNKGVIDTVYFQPGNKIGSQDEISKLVIVNGKWQIWGFTDEHEIKFVPRNTQGLAKFPTVKINQ